MTPATDETRRGPGRRAGDRADAATLAHCRQPGEHVRGCWVVDLLTGRQRGGPVARPGRDVAAWGNAGGRRRGGAQACSAKGMALA
jgi:hypothetical protein